ncbi:hypothetical protein PWG14_20875 (plasmid) [Chromobacterium amazonense]|uniref:hypothetical protein n=1 Tax=Chromobacterium amazonense TaxID=1382803 RepID=UPI00237DF895|nr:hypothetical protein [Chromobacterium amazonense]MDE1714946.1 hypothetical protein [Chromobacterium amazonense]
MKQMTMNTCQTADRPGKGAVSKLEEAQRAAQKTPARPKGAVLLELLPDNTMRVTKQGNTAILFANLERAFQIGRQSIQMIGG